MGLLSKADSAKLEETKITVPPTADLAAVISPSAELRGLLLFFNERLFRHVSFRRYRAGSPSSRRGSACLARGLVLIVQAQKRPNSE
jgi:hypothetical protein